MLIGYLFSQYRHPEAGLDGVSGVGVESFRQVRVATGEEFCFLYALHKAHQLLGATNVPDSVHCQTPNSRHRYRVVLSLVSIPQIGSPSGNPDTPVQHHPGLTGLGRTAQDTQPLREQSLDTKPLCSVPE